MQWNNQLNGKLTQTFCFSIFSDSKLQNDNEEKNKFRIKLETEENCSPSDSVGFNVRKLKTNSLIFIKLNNLSKPYVFNTTSQHLQRKKKNKSNRNSICKYMNLLKTYNKNILVLLDLYFFFQLDTRVCFIKSINFAELQIIGLNIK